MGLKQTSSCDYDQVITSITDYMIHPPNFSEEAYHTARTSLADALGCAILALKYRACTKLLGPIVKGTIIPNGARVPGTSYVLDPIQAAFNIGTMIRWLDFNDTWLAAEWGHPSDNLGGILAIMDFVSRVNQAEDKTPFTVKETVEAMIQAYEIQGILALHNSFNRLGLDHVILVKIATTAVTAKLWGATPQQIQAAISNAWMDLGPLRAYRHAPNTGSRKSWAAGDATSRGVQLAWMAMQGEMGYPTVLTAPKWGLYDVLSQGKPFELTQSFGNYVMENVLYKIAFPAEFHAQTAVEAAVQLHPQIKDRLEEIVSIEISTHDSAIRIIDKKGPLNNPADRDHCLQYMIAIPLLFGNLTADHYEDEAAKDPRIDQLRNKMVVKENEQYSIDYHDPSKRSIANSITIRFSDQTILGPVTIEYPLGHRRRRKEGLPLLFNKFESNLKTHFSAEKTAELSHLFQEHHILMSMTTSNLMDAFCL